MDVGYKMKWMKQSMYVLKTQEGVIVRLQEQRPLEYKEPNESKLSEAFRALDEHAKKNKKRQD